MKLVYFASTREQAGLAEEIVELPQYVTSVKELIEWQISRGPGYEAAFAIPEMVHVAIDQRHVDHDQLLNDAQEIAFFPPMTGG